jgi:hypothetical protein
LGTATVDLSELVNGVTQEFTIPLQRVKSGTVHYSLTAYNIGKNETSKSPELDSIYSSGSNTTVSYPKPTAPSDSVMGDDDGPDDQIHYKMLHKIGKGLRFLKANLKVEWEQCFWRKMQQKPKSL